MICRRRRILVLLLRKLEMTDLSTAGSTQMKPRIGIGVIPLYETRLRGRPQVCLGMKMSYAVQAHGDFTHRNRKSLISTCREWKPSITYHATPCNPHAHIGVERSPPDCSAASASPYRKRNALHTSYFISRQPKQRSTPTPIVNPCRNRSSRSTPRLPAPSHLPARMQEPLVADKQESLTPATRDLARFFAFPGPSPTLFGPVPNQLLARHARP